MSIGDSGVAVFDVSKRDGSVATGAAVAMIVQKTTVGIKALFMRSPQNPGMHTPFETPQP